VVDGQRLLIMNLDAHFLLASVFWSGVASGYWIYGWKQKSWIPLAGGAVMMGVSFFMPALTMSLVSIAVIFAVWWLMKRGY
jgi:multidrug transporter EmrE-like cation transporter